MHIIHYIRTAILLYSLFILLLNQFTCAILQQLTSTRIIVSPNFWFEPNYVELKLHTYQLDILCVP